MPFVRMIAGPNGSGKSTLTRRMLADGIDLGFYINPDDIAANSCLRAAGFSMTRLFQT